MMPGHGFANPNDAQNYSRRSKRRQRINKRGHPLSKGCKPRPYDKQKFNEGYDGIDWGKAPWRQEKNDD